MLAMLLLAMPGQVAAREIKPGVERWPIKTSIPADSDVAQQKSVPYLDLVKLADPDPPVARNDTRYQSARIPPFVNDLNVKEGDIISTTGWLHLVAEEDDGDYHIQLSDSPDSQSNCLIVEVPNPDPVFVVDPTLRPSFEKVRDFIKTRLLGDRDPSPRGSIMNRPTFVRVTGQLFYDDAHVGTAPRGKKGCKAETLWELHPVTDIEFATP